MNASVLNITPIEKEILNNLHFPNQEVLISQEERGERKYNIERAMKLGNLFKDKVKIVFEDTEGMKMVETTIWGTTNECLLLKRGMAIPLNRVHQVII